MCLGVRFFASVLLGLSVFPGLVCLLLYQIQKVFFHYLFKEVFNFLLFSSPSGTPMIWTLVHLKLSQRLVSLSLFFGFFFLFSSLIECFFLHMFQISLIWFSASSTLLLRPCKLFFISISGFLVSDWNFLCCWSPH